MKFQRCYFVVQFSDLMLYLSPNVFVDITNYIRFLYANIFNGINMQLISFTSTINLKCKNS
jgi:hypothetical protein